MKVKKLIRMTLHVTAMALCMLLLETGDVFAGPPNGKYTMTFNDEFDGTKLDLTKWDTVAVCCGHSQFDAANLGSNCLVGNGILRERLMRGSVNGSNYLSAAITSLYKQQFGYFEIRCKLPTGMGLWPAFWLDGKEPNHYEMDVMEYWAGCKSGWILGRSLHKWTDGHDMWGGDWIGSSTYESDYHTFGMVWRPNNSATLYVDGQEYASSPEFYRNADFSAMPVCANFQSYTDTWMQPCTAIDASTPLPAYYDIDYIRIYQNSDFERKPYLGTPMPIPGTIEMENYDLGGQGIAYYDADNSNQGGEYRPGDGVDIQKTADGGYSLGWVYADEWVKYIVDVAETGFYNMDCYTASAVYTSTFRIEFDGADKTNAITARNTGSWNNFANTAVNFVYLTKGVHEMKFRALSGVNIDKIKFTRVKNCVIKNRANSYYLHESNGLAFVGASPTDESYLWDIERVDFHIRMHQTDSPTDDKIVELKNKKTGNYLNIQNLRGQLEVTPRDPVWSSTRWIIEPGVDNIGNLLRFRSRWKNDQFIRLPDSGNEVVYTAIDRGWWSAQWYMEAMVSADAGRDQELAVSTRLTTLDGSASYVPNGSTATYQWKELSSNGAILENATSAVTKASNLKEGTVYSFELAVSDGTLVTRDTVAIRVLSYTVQNIPGKIEAENFYSMQDIILDNCSDEGGGRNIGRIDAGDFLTYTANVEKAGVYKVEFRVASVVSNTKMELFSNNTSLGVLTIPAATGGYQIWQTFTMDVTLQLGVQTLKFVALTNGFNFNWLNFHYYEIIPGKIEAENYYLMQNVLLDNCSDDGGGENIGAIDAGDFLTYTANVETAGVYTANFRVASDINNAKMELFSNNTSLGVLTIPSATGSYQSWQSFSMDVNLQAGAQTLKFVAITYGFNFNWMEFALNSLSTSNNDIINDPLIVSPNPTTGNICLTLNGNTCSKSVEILDMMGNIIIQREHPTHQILLDITNFPNGIYLVKLTTDKGVFTQKIIKRQDI